VKFIIGLLLGIAIAGGVAYYLNKMPTPFVDKQITSANANNLPSASAPLVLAPGVNKLQTASSAPLNNNNTVASAPSHAVASAPNYDFYDVLQGNKNLATKPNASAVVENVEHGYFVQVGAFSDQNLANDMKARLALLGINAKIKSLQQKNKVINRVIVGPFNLYDDAQDIVKQLQQQQISATIINQ
jgi:cell division protein FtsN